MSGTQSVTVIGGTSSSQLTGLVTIPLDVQASVASSLQALLGGSVSGAVGGYSASVTSGLIYLSNINVAGLSGIVAVGDNTTGNPGILELTNTNANGSIVGGNATISATEAANYSTLIVEAPGAETVIGNTGTNNLDIFAKNSSVRFGTGGGSGSIVAGGADDFVSVTSGSWSITGSTDGSDSISTFGNTTINTYGVGGAGTSNGYTEQPGTSASNVIGVKGGSAVINSGGTDDLIEVFSNASAVISVSGATSANASADILVGGGSATVYAAPNSSNIEAFFETGGSLYFVNQSSVMAYVTGDVSGATGGSATVYGGTGGGYFIAGTGGNSTLIGGFAPGQTSTPGGAGLVTLIGGGSSNNLLEATGSITGGGNTQNVLIAGGTGVVIGGNSTLIATGTTSVNTFEAGNANSLVVSTSGAGTQTFDMITGGYTETVTGSTAATAKNIFIFDESSVSAGNTDVITNFSFASGNDTISITGGANVAAVSSITGGAGGTLVTLNDGTYIKLVGLTYSNTYQTYVGKTTL